MGSVVSSLAALFIILPVLLYLIVFVGIKQWTKNHRRAQNAAVNVTTIILIFSVYFLSLVIWERSFTWAIILFMLMTAVAFTILYWKLKEEIIYSKVFIGYWRLNFLLFTILYLGLVLYGVASRAIDAIVGF